MAALAACAVAVAGCGTHARAISEATLPKLVLQQRDLPGFTLYDSGPITRFDVTAGPRADLARFGRTGGWKADWKRPGSAQTRGPLVVQSRVDAFGGSRGAERDFDAYRTQLRTLAARAPTLVRVVRAPVVGDSSFAVTERQPGAPATRFYTVAWRDGRVSASVVVTGFEGRLRLADAARLARVQERRIAAALRPE